MLIIGGGPSGIDLASVISKVANEVTLSITKPKKQEDEDKIRKQLPATVALKYNVKCFTANGADFVDGTHQNFTKIIYATGNLNNFTFDRRKLAIIFSNPRNAGYNYSYPFLSVDSGIYVDDNFVEPLYKRVFNINNPTMAFIGAMRTVLTFNTYDIQVNIRFVIDELLE